MDLRGINAEKKSAEICEISGRKNKKDFPRMTQINAENESEKICGICGEINQGLL